MTLASISEALRAYRQGRMVIVVDDEDRENEGDLCLAADFVSPEAISFMACHGRGLICVPMPGEQIDRLRLPMLATVRDEPERCGDAPNFAVPVDARFGIESGISAVDRTTTVRTLLDPTSRPADLTCPGHVFPLRYTPGGVLRRRGQTEASVDLAILAGLSAAAVICEVMNPDGTMARLDVLCRLGTRFNIPVVSVEQIAQYRLRVPSAVA